AGGAGGRRAGRVVAVLLAQRRGGAHHLQLEAGARRVAALDAGAVAAALAGGAGRGATAGGRRRVAHGARGAGGDDLPARERIAARLDVGARAAQHADDARVAARERLGVTAGGAAAGDHVEAVAA